VNSIDVLLRIADGLNLPDPARNLPGLASRPVAETEANASAPGHASERARTLNGPLTAMARRPVAVSREHVDAVRPTAAMLTDVEWSGRGSQ
jgi:hypothetical protein